MEIREANDNDIPEIIGVLKLSLGESKLKKTKEIWEYKHFENPFGKSLILVAILNEKIVGVRAFMRWKWVIGKNEFSSFRAVDTATLPEYQGKGVFKKLTMEAIDMAGKRESNSLIFNTPNALSKPGYLKMGWQEIDKLKVQIIFLNPLRFGKPKNVDFEYFKGQKIKELLTEYNKSKSLKNRLFTPKTSEYLDWRYAKNPLQKYYIKECDSFFIALYVKHHKKFTELRISEIIFKDKAALKDAFLFANQLASQLRINIISCQAKLELSKFKIQGKFGPTFTVRNINIPKENFDAFCELSKWDYSLGDLELF